MVSKVSYRSSGPQRGDVIVFDPPPPHDDSQFPFIKRVIGLPGEIVEIEDGRVSINGTPLDEEYIIAPRNEPMSPIEVPDNEYFVLGDNRNNSSDSSQGWTVPRDNIIGKAWFNYWPPSKLGAVKHYRYPYLSEAGEYEISVNYSYGVQLE